MSEYQYYEFVALDRPLSQEQIAELRALTTRATITPTRFQNIYHWGSFRGNADSSSCFDDIDAHGKGGMAMTRRNCAGDLCEQFGVSYPPESR